MLAALRENSGSVERRQLRRRHNETPRRRNTRQTCWSLTSPSAAASRGAVQVACPKGGVLSSFCRMRFSVSASYRRGLPGRLSSARPASRWSAKRVRHFDTRAARVPNWAAIFRFDIPCAANKMMRDLSAARRSLLCARPQPSNVRRSPALSRISVAILAMHQRLIHTVIYDSKH